VAADSSRGHVSDIKLGWKYATEHFWTGIGPRAPQLPGLAANRAQRIYVHNEWLLDWLRFGLLAPLLVTALFGIIAGRSLRTLRHANSSTTERAAAVFGLMVPVCLLASPFLSTSNRWPLLIGIAAGILCAPAAVGHHGKPLAVTTP
jgi:O-antigen ligase